MDWSKAKSIIIFVLLALNIFLFYTLGVNLQGSKVSKETLDTTAEILIGKGAGLDCKLPAFKGVAPRLLYTGGTELLVKAAEKLLPSKGFTVEELEKGIEENGNKVALNNKFVLEYTCNAPDSTVDTNNKPAVTKYLLKYLKNLGIETSNLRLDTYTESSEGIVATYVEQKGKYLVFSNYITARVSSQGIRNLTISHREISGFSSESRSEIMPAHEVLLKNINLILSHSEKRNTIERIDLGYKPAAEINEEIKANSEGAAWRIGFKDGTYLYFEALKGTEIK